MTEYIAVLPDGIDSTASHTYLRLPHPRSGAPQLYLPTPTGLCEVSKLTGSRGRTWFVGDNVSPGAMLLHHPIDPVFLAIPLALSLLHPDRTTPFQPLADLLTPQSHFDLKPAFSSSAAPAHNPDAGRLVAHMPFRRAFRACCERKLVDAVPTPEEAYYRPSRAAMLAIVRAKVDSLAAADTFDKFDHLVRGLGRDGLLEPSADPALVHAARVSAAIEHVAQYLPPPLLASLTASYDLDAYNAYLADRVAAARAAEAPVVIEKKQKTTKRKLAKTESSRGVEALKKVNTNGMAKMTSFFKPTTK
ncbi:hypothetical protein CspeluHIS016_0503570 [Cutaneotrichosporon spelunceum]|uniref:Rnh202 triple barrel domain-containing protein n=1 Tax=Cutaneotrichosporon spelunceum TaxID=1672016 RepID=A0AAD3YCP0_9TREE|nr:hypothetical protein CspeluHIS016_0503570 [Cutaneotrichosporon spelunceum]